MDAPNKIEKEYSVTDKKTVTLSVLIGDGQQGDPVVMLDNVLLKIGHISALEIGSGEKLRGKTLFIKTVVNDVNPKTNHTSIVYVLDGGASLVHDINEGVITNDGGAMVYRDSYKFI